MKICIINLESYITGGGAMTVSKQLSSALAALGHDVHLLCLSINDTAEKLPEVNYTIHQIMHPTSTNNIFVSSIKKIKYI